MSLVRSLVPRRARAAAAVAVVVAAVPAVADVRHAGRATNGEHLSRRWAPVSARSGPAPSCPRYHGSGIPRGSGIPPWGFHASQSFRGGRRGVSHGWGDVNLHKNWISGRICQDVFSAGGATRTIEMRVGPHITYHSTRARMWGYPGNEIKTSLRIVASRDPACHVGTRGRVVMFASYNGVRTDSMKFSFPGGCRYENRLYHGRQVDAQVPPL